jgi:hypothetical protein
MTIPLRILENPGLELQGDSGEIRVSGLPSTAIRHPQVGVIKSQLKERSKLVDSNNRTVRRRLQVKNEHLGLK